jgi:hypothetical protein
LGASARCSDGSWTFAVVLSSDLYSTEKVNVDGKRERNVKAWEADIARQHSYRAIRRVLLFAAAERNTSSEVTAFVTRDGRNLR